MQHKQAGGLNMQHEQAGGSNMQHEQAGDLNTEHEQSGVQICSTNKQRPGSHLAKTGSGRHRNNKRK